jgi:hypothetical protein
MTSSSSGSARQPSDVLELQRMALAKAISSLDLDATQSCSSCNSESCNGPHQRIVAQAESL